ncbi:MAG TPA: dihydrodipicolinate synthase family protein [Rhodothermales bacterium]|nr:dihydrodipicolinate synthase family protein [Rhodothermales bacterium]
MEQPEATTTPWNLIRLRRKITGMSAILLPFTDAGRVDWAGFESHVARTAESGLVPAVNMDTGYVNLLDDATRREVLARTKAVLGGASFVAGAFVQDLPGARWRPDRYVQQVERIQKHGGTPILFQSFGLVEQDAGEIVAAYAEVGRHCSAFIAFELGKMFAPFGRIYDIDTIAGLMEIPQCIGIKHSSLSRELEWERLILRNERRPDFKIFTGNDLAIDMVMYGSDYLLGLSTFAPDLFARRDALWESGDPAFYERNDLLQYLGQFAFRAPVPAYKHSAAQFLKLRGWLGSDVPHPAATRRPDSDLDVLREIAERLGVLESQPLAQ